MTPAGTAAMQPRHRGGLSFMTSLGGEGHSASTTKASVVRSHQLTEQPSSFLVDELMQMRAELREQVALLHAKVDAATRVHSDAQSTLNILASQQLDAQTYQQQATAASDKMLRSFAQDFDARLELLEQRVASNHSLQAMNEDLMRLKLSDKDTSSSHDTSHRYHEVAAQAAATDSRVSSLVRAHDAMAEQLRQVQTKWRSQHSDHESRIAQTFELAHTLSSGQALLEEKHALDAQVVTSQFHKVFQRLEHAMATQVAGNQGLERSLANVVSEVTTLQTLHDVQAAELRDHVTALRGQCIQNTTALRLLADEVLKLKHAKTEEFRRLQHDKVVSRSSGRRPDAAAGDKDLMAELDHALRHTSNACSSSHH